MKYSDSDKHRPQPTCVHGLSTYHRSQVASLYKEPFIISGYRKQNPSFAECVGYAFVGHNDVWNFWTHFLPIFIWLPWLYYLSYQYNLSEPYYYPLLIYWLGAIACAFFSSSAHLFGFKSPLFQSVFFMLDYLGIVMHLGGGGLYTLYYQQPLSSPLFDYTFPLVSFYLLFCLFAIISCSLSRYFWVKQRFIIRALSVAPPYLIAISPFVMRVLVCFSVGEDCMYETLHFHFIALTLSWLMLFFFVSKIPERYAPGYFDFFQSHTLFHTSHVGCVSVQMYIFPIDCDLRKADLLERISPGFDTVILPYLIMVILGVLQVLILAGLVMKGVLIPNKMSSTSDLQLCNGQSSRNKQD